MSHPTFGQKVPGADYKSRYGVYAVIPDPQHEKIILVQAPNGAWFLPGGEIEAGENHLEALRRELIEELGFTAQIGHYYGQADEYFYSRHRDSYFYNPAYIYEVLSFEKSQEPLEDFNQLAWFPIDQAIDQLKRDSHKWGIQMWKKQHSLPEELHK
ncbi:NUDIX hydrolase [Streptococcus oricebi]|uniref:NUDIX hydrolase n=1 Tax=Streptococcus oricebi TaxID=1547447 RepID=A0ABS5B1K6_9STRE|nr:NUDIX hydrolase [Streptococcus oricebi]MBP2622710.1 NUDIX hydrolase [Streptococcus oricebi]